MSSGQDPPLYVSKRRTSSQFHATPSQAFRRPPTNTGGQHTTTTTTTTHVPAVPAKPLTNIMTTKNSRSPAPLWQELDDTFEERLRVKRRREESGIYSARRITDRRRPAAKSNDNDAIDVNQPDRPKANIRPQLRINRIDQPDNSDSDHDEPRYRPQAKIRSRKSMTAPRPQSAPKKSAARKVNYVNTTSSEEDDSDDSDDSNKEPSSKSEEEEEEEDQLDSDQYDVDMDEAPPLPFRERTPPEIMLLDSPPRTTTPLPQPDRDFVNIPPTSPSPSIDQPPDELLKALESFTLSTIRMQKTHQLPFLLRNVREGFLSRCRTLGVPIYSDDNRKLSLCVRYDSVAGLSYKTDISKWLCPLCEIHGTFRTREMLSCHLQWDHAEVFYEWSQMDYTEESESWNLQLVIPEPEIQIKTEDSERKSESHSIPSISQTATPAVDDDDEKTQPSTISSTPIIKLEATPIRTPYSPFPYVSISPSLSSTERSTTTTTDNTSTTDTLSNRTTLSTDVETKNISRLDKLKIQDPDLPSRSLSLTSQSNSTKSTNTTRSSFISNTTRSSTTTTTLRPDRPTRYPTPPPADNLLGPAAQPPYLPAKSEYAENLIVHRSYRPGGPCLFDLLNTLPLTQFGVLDWEILDREEEIYESDDVREEYKVMHALWARWIMLNRNKFIANYYKGMIAFVDEYWKIIHRAAGWDALRYWLLMLLSNRFLTGHDVAQVLLHYEDLVGMAFW